MLNHPFLKRNYVNNELGEWLTLISKSAQQIPTPTQLSSKAILTPRTLSVTRSISETNALDSKSNQKFRFEPPSKPSLSNLPGKAIASALNSSKEISRLTEAKITDESKFSFAETAQESVLDSYENETSSDALIRAPSYKKPKNFK